MIILASKSMSRRAMLEAAGISHQVISGDLDERALEATLQGASPPEIAIALARAKALCVSREQPGRLVLGSDSLVEVDGRRFDKPVDREEAERHLRFFSGKQMLLFSAAAIARDETIVFADCEMATLAVRRLSEEFIQAYLDDEWPDVGSCVGVFRIEGRGVHLFEHIEGDRFTVLGMPLFRVLSALRDFGELPG